MYGYFEQLLQGLPLLTAEALVAVSFHRREQKTMEDYNILRMQDRLKEYLTRDRFIHTQGVMYTATALAMCHGEDLVKAQVAGLLHDCAKCIPTGKKLKICKKNDIALTRWEEENEALLQCHPVSYHRQGRYDAPGKDRLYCRLY